MRIERLTEFYIPEVERLEKLCFSVPWSHSTLMREIKNPMCVYLAAVDNLLLLGYAGMQTVLDEGYINNIAVSPAHRRQGVGGALIYELIRRAKELELSFVSLEVRESNAPAIALYEKFGFSAVGRRSGYYEKPREDAIIMTLFLDKKD